jgi:hypothetical protein
MSVNLERLEGGLHPFAEHPILGRKSRLAGAFGRQEYERAKREVLRLAGELRDAGHEVPIAREEQLARPRDVFPALMDLEQEIKSIEFRHREMLEGLAKRTVAEAYGLSEKEADELFPKTKLMDRPEPPSPMPRPPRAPLDEKLRELVDKRVSHNLLIQGEAINHMTKALVLAKNEIDAIDPVLYQKYLLHANLAQVMQFLVPAPEPERPHHLVAGEKRLSWKGGVPQVEAKGVVFPILVQELSKGVMETVFAHGLPKPGELTEPQLDAFQFHADHPTREAWHFMLGPPVADRVRAALAKHKAWVQYGEQPDAPRDALYTYTLLSMLPAKDLQAHLGNLLRAPSPDKEREAALMLRARLKSREREHTGEGRE